MSQFSHLQQILHDYEPSVGDIPQAQAAVNRLNGIIRDIRRIEAYQQEERERVSTQNAIEEHGFDLSALASRDRKIFQTIRLHPLPQTIGNRPNFIVTAFLFSAKNDIYRNILF